MIFETTSLLLAIGVAAVPSWFYHTERLDKKKIELQYRIRIAQTLGHAATLRDHETGKHNLRVTYIAGFFGEDLGLDKATLQTLMKGAFLHDVGKIGIKDSILLKNGSLDKEEWKEMQFHPIYGKELLENMPWFKEATAVVMHHHEKYDGTGYPEKLKGKKIPLVARIFAIIDVFDALLNARPYKKAFSLEETLEILQDGSSTHFDPEILEKFLFNAPKYTQDITNKTEKELHSMLEMKRKTIFGI